MINKSSIDKMLEMPDDRLWTMLKLVLGGAGVNVGNIDMDKKKIRKIRALLGEVTDDDIGRVLHLAEIYKKGG